MTRPISNDDFFFIPTTAAVHKAVRNNGHFSFDIFILVWSR